MLTVAALLLVEEELADVIWLAVEVDVKSGKIQIWHMHLFTEGKVHSLSQGGDSLRERERERERDQMRLTFGHRRSLTQVEVEVENFL